MKKIDNRPLTEMKTLPINISAHKHIDLTQTNISNPEERIRKLLQQVAKLKDSGIILAQGVNSEEYVMAVVTPSKRKSKALIFPEPNPVTIYYNSGVDHIESALEIRKVILNNDWNPDELYPVFLDFYKESFQGLTQMIMSVEALFNQKIPEDIILEYEGESLTKEKIEWKKLKTKLKYLIPKLTDIDLYANYNGDYQNILNINNIRNDLVHLKSIKKNNFTYYQSLCKELIDFDYEKNCQSVYNVLLLLM